MLKQYNCLNYFIIFVKLFPKLCLEREKIMRKRGVFGILKTVLVCSLILTVLPIQTIVFADEKAVSTFTELKEAIENANNGDTIQLKNDIEMEKGIAIPDGKTITIQSEGGNIYKLKYSDQYGSFYLNIDEGAKLTLKNIHIQGDASQGNSAALINNSGTLVLEQGTIISDNHITVPSYRGAGGIYNTGTLTMKDGALIENCSHSEGGKAVANESIFYMEGGHLKGNEKGGYGVLLNMSQQEQSPKFYMSGGKIDGPLGTFEGDNRGGVYNEGDDILIRIGGDVEIGPVALDLTNNNYIQVDNKLEKKVVICPGRAARTGKVIAKGYNYTLTEEDKDKIELTTGTLRLDTVENALILDLPTPVITGMKLDRETLPYKYGSLSVTIIGENLPDKMLVSAFENSTKTDIENYTSGSSTSNTTYLSFPENTEKTPKEYTIKVSSDYGKNWSTIVKTVTVAAQPTLANAKNNTFVITPQKITTDTPIRIEAIGDRQNEEGVMEGDQRYIPSTCGPDHTPFQYIDNAYVAQLPPLREGIQTIYVYYDLKEYKNGSWENGYSSDRKEQMIQVEGAPKLTAVYVDKENLPYTGEKIQVSIEGEHLSDHLFIKAFHDNTVTDIQVYTKGDTTRQTAMLNLPANTRRTEMSYTIKISMDDGASWNPIEKKVTVGIQPVLADANKNTFRIDPSSITTDTPVKVSATGDHQEEQGVVAGDERYIPVTCNELAFQHKQNAYIAELPALPQGKQVLRVIYVLERYDGTTWMDTKTRDIKETSVYVMGVPKVTGMNVSKEIVSYTGETVQVNIQGEYLEKGMLVKAFANQQPTEIQGYTGETGSTILSFPANEARTPQVYTVKVSLNQGATWEFLEKEIIVEGKPIAANPENNTIEIPFGKIIANTKVVIKAMGDRQEEQGVVAGDERYIPKEWKFGKEVFQYEEGKNVTELTSLSEGLHKLEVTYTLERFDGTQWIDTFKRDTKSKMIRVEKEVFNDPMLVLYTKKLTLFVGDTSKVEYRFLSNDKEIGLNWESMDTEIAEVDASGVVRAKHSGSTIIKISTSDGKYTAESEVQVLEKEKENTKQSTKENGIVETGSIANTIWSSLFICIGSIAVVLYIQKRRRIFKK